MIVFLAMIYSNIFPLYEYNYTNTRHFSPCMIIDNSHDASDLRINCNVSLGIKYAAGRSGSPVSLLESELL